MLSYVTLRICFLRHLSCPMIKKLNCLSADDGSVCYQTGDHHHGNCFYFSLYSIRAWKNWVGEGCCPASCPALWVLSNPGSYIKRTATGDIKFISISVFEEREGMDWTHKCRFCFYELIWSVWRLSYDVFMCIYYYVAILVNQVYVW